jgi:4-alpha-glucanotransferase
MIDETVRALAGRAGISVEWVDFAGEPRVVPIEALRRILVAMGLPCESPSEINQSLHQLDARARETPYMLTATVGAPIAVPVRQQGPVRLVAEDGTTQDVPTREERDGSLRLPPLAAPGYYRLETADHVIALAIAPVRCHTVEYTAPNRRPWGLAVQVYGLRRAGDCGIGDMGGVSALAEAAARQGADALALSPTHAMFTAAPDHFSPYSPSNRLFHNPLHADARTLFGDARVRKAFETAGANRCASALETAAEIDWPRAARLKLSVFHRLFDDFVVTDVRLSNALATDFQLFRAAGGPLLEQHALFEALHAHFLGADPNAHSWRTWAAEWRNPAGPAVIDFARRHAREIEFHCFLQWLADRSLAAAQRKAKEAGMRGGLVADLAVGMSKDGSHAWARQCDILGGLAIGAPPDLFNARGQNWDLTTFSPLALLSGGFEPFLDTLRATMRHAGGVRIDHAMGLMRLWVIPDGADPADGAYLAYPLDDLLRLTALESHRHCAIVVGEDLGTVPEGLRERLAETGISGMRVLWFERQGDRFLPPTAWSVEAAAMTSTHDLPTVAGWWSGADIAVREQCGLIRDGAKERAERQKDCAELWAAFRAAKAGDGPQPKTSEGSRIADAAVRFIARTASRLALLPAEDALALKDQPNLPASINEHPNWRRRYKAEAALMLEDADVRRRLAALAPANA